METLVFPASKEEKFSKKIRENRYLDFFRDRNGIIPFNAVNIGQTLNAS